MNKAVWGSGLCAALLLTVCLTGIPDRQAAVHLALTEGGARYGQAEYAAALRIYEEALAENPDNPTLRYNAAQAAARSGDDAKAITYYDASSDSTDKYLHAGNARVRLGDAAGDPGQALQLYIQALETYRDGILLYPQHVPLKVNYEILQAKIEALLEDAEAAQDSQGEEGDGEEGDGEQEENGESAQEQDGDAAEDADSGDDTRDGTADSEAGDDSQTQDAGDSNDEEQDMEAIARILEILESREDESLKNNREIKVGGEDKYGW